MLMKNLRTILCVSMLSVTSLSIATAQRRPRANASGPDVPANILLRIMRAEDQRRWDDSLKTLLSDKDAKVRRRAALAAGRIGDERAVPSLVAALQQDTDNDVRQMAAFGLGETESLKGADALIAVLLNDGGSWEVRARAIEALGKIAAPVVGSPIAYSGNDLAQATLIGKAILEQLTIQTESQSQPNRLTILLGLTAALRAKPDGVGPVIVKFLNSSDSRIVADSLNTLTRLRLKDGNDQARQLLVKHSDPIVRANAARVLGATEDKEAFDALLDRALDDDDLRVRVSAIRALGSLKDAHAVQPLLQRGNSLLISGRLSTNELLEIAATLGRMLPNTFDQGVVTFLRRMHDLTKGEAPEVEIAFARIAPGLFQNESYRAELARKNVSWRRVSARAQGLAAIKDVIVGAATGSAGDSALKGAKQELSVMLRPQATPAFAVPNVLQAYNSFKPADAGDVVKGRLQASDVIVRATAAEILGDVTPSEEIPRLLNNALKDELPKTEKGELNDAALSILDALAKQKSAAANDAIKTALDSSDHLIRRRAVALFKANGVGDFSDRIGFVKTRYTDADYRRAIARIGKTVRATVVTSKGPFTIEFLPADAPLTVDNFVMLARKGYFNGQTVPRVVPNFVVQTGDPRGDQNGGPGYSIRCEINQAPYERAAVGMALSGKDTGGSQWFVTHSPQPHLDGGYTIFGRVVSGMEVVDRIARGDTIRRMIVK